MFKKFFYSVLGIALLFAGYLHFINPNFVKDILRAKTLASLVTQVDPVSLDSTLTTVTQVPPEQMPQSLDALYRPKPDRRFLRAVGEIHEFFTQQPSENPELEFQNNQWLVSFADKSVGALPAFPDFPDYMVLLKKWVHHLNQEYPVNLVEGGNDIQLEMEKRLNQFYHPHAASVSRQMNTMWTEGKRHPWMLQSAARSLVLLSFQNLDRMEIADMVPGTAMAWLAISQELTPFPMLQDEILLADTMKYSNHAVRISKSLPKTDSLRLFVDRDERSLKKQALSKNSDPRTRYFWLHFLAERGELEPWAEWFAEGFGQESLYLSLLKTGLDMKSFLSQRSFPREIQQVILLDIEREGGLESSEQFSKATLMKLIENPEYVQVLAKALGLYTLIGQFESKLELLDKHYSGPFLKTETYKTFYRGYFYSSVYVEGLFYLDTLSSTKAALWFSKELGKGPTDIGTRVERIGKNIKKIIKNEQAPEERSSSLFQQATNLSSPAKEFKIWYDHLIAAEESNGTAQEMINDLTELPYLGVPAALRSWKDIRPYFKTGDNASWICLRRLMQRLDTRPDHLYEIHRLALDDLLDPIRAEIAIQHLLRLSSNRFQNKEIWYWYYKRDTKQLLNVLKNPRIAVSKKTYALVLLNRMGSYSGKPLIREYDRLIKQNPDNWYLRKRYADYLAEKKKFAKARKIISDWLKRDPKVGGLQIPRAHTRIARYFYKEGKYRQALKENAIALKSGTGDSMILAGRILLKLNRNEEARKIFENSYDRYPGTHTLATLAGYFWAVGEIEDAATLIARHPLPITGLNWNREIGKEFSEAHKDQPVEQGKKAFLYLKSKIKDFTHLVEISGAVHGSGNDKLAFQLLGSLLLTNDMAKVVNQVRAATYLKNYAGADQAANWLQGKTTGHYRRMTISYLYLEEEYGLLWKYSKSPNDYVSLILVASSLKEKNLSPKNRKTIMSYYNLPGVEQNEYGLVGSYLLGKTSEKQVMQAMTSDKKRCDNAYYLGVKAESEGRFRKAVSWYRSAVEVGHRINFQYIYSLRALHRLIEEEKSLLHRKSALSQST